MFHSDVELPLELHDALVNGKLVIFAGAGVSMGPPSNLPGFEGLARDVIQDALGGRQQDEPLDQYLGRADLKGVKVQLEVRKQLDIGNSEPTSLHRDLVRNFEALDLGPGFPPRVGGRIAAFADHHALTALDGETGRVLWKRAAFGREGVLLHTASGHFDCDFDDLRSLTFATRSRSERERPWAEFATRLFDPKRVRAARAGVELAYLGR